MKAWERLEEIIKWTGLSTHAFAMELGLKRSENLYRVRQEKNGVSRKLAETIVARYPEINLIWLFTGDGQMFCKDRTVLIQKNNISVYESLKNTEDPIFSLSSTIFSDSDLGVKLDGDAMSPIAPNGAVLLLKKMNDTSIIYGQMYYFLYQDVYMLRYIRKGEGNNFILSVVNTEQYDDMSVEASCISFVYIVNYILNKLV